MVDGKIGLETTRSIMNELYSCTCPKCGSHNVRCVEISFHPGSLKEQYRMVCHNCFHIDWSDINELYTVWNMDHRADEDTSMKNDISKKIITKQRVVRTYATTNDSHFKATENLVTAFNQGWKVIMCHPIGELALEYILEKECEEQ